MSSSRSRAVRASVLTIQASIGAARVQRQIPSAPRSQTAPAIQLGVVTLNNNRALFDMGEPFANVGHENGVRPARRAD